MFVSHVVPESGVELPLLSPTFWNVDVVEDAVPAGVAATVAFEVMTPSCKCT